MKGEIVAEGEPTQQGEEPADQTGAAIERLVDLAFRDEELALYHFFENQSPEPAYSD